MATVTYTREALAEFDNLPTPIKERVEAVVARLGEWPEVSGAKPLRGEMKGGFRIRTGAYRVLFRPSADGDAVVVWKVGHRSDVYE